MEYFDEEVISAMHIKRREEYGNIEEGLYILNSLTLFHKVLLFEEKLSVLLPNNFVIMLPELVETKYISEKKPDVIYTSLDGSVNFSFNLLTTSSGEKDMHYAINMLKTMIKNMNPAYIFFEDKKIENSKNIIISEKNIEKAFLKALELRENEDECIFVVGSFYLLGEVKKVIEKYF